MARDTKKCIADFIAHVQELESEEGEGGGFDREYRIIHEVQVKNRREEVFKTEVGKQQQNLVKNRYKDIVPYDDHRVVLSTIEGEEGSDYVNASRLMGVQETGGYIASQGPVAATVNDFWRMVWEYNVEIIFMACKIVELGKIKCKQYWNDVGKSDEFGDITVYTENEEESSSDFTERMLRLTRGEEERTVIQFHYRGWPDHGIPDDPAHIRDLISIMRQARKNNSAPLLVHCSAGCGRTGAIVAIDYVWTLLETGRFDEKFNLSELICKFRTQRMSIVQTPDQYALVNKVLKTICEEWLEKMASHTYENVDLEFSPVNEVANDTDDEAENVYANMDDTPPSSAEAGAIQESLSTGTDSNKKTCPVVVEIPPPSQRKKAQMAPIPLDNGVDQDSKSELVPQSPTSTKSDEKPLHKTVIQIGSSAPASSQQRQTSSGKPSLAPTHPLSQMSSSSQEDDSAVCPAPSNDISSASPANPASATAASLTNPSPNLHSQLETDTSATPNTLTGQKSNGVAVNGDSFQLPQDLVTRL